MTLLGARPLNFPTHDPQFWIATAIFVFAAAWLLRGVLPVPWLSRRRERARTERKVTLTVHGHSLKK